MEFAVIENNTVVNIVVAEDINDIYASPSQSIISANGTFIGATYSNSAFSTPQSTPKSKEGLKAEVETEFMRRCEAGVSYDSRLFTVSPEDRNNMVALVSGAELFGDLWSGYNWDGVVDPENGLYTIEDIDALRLWAATVFSLGTPIYSARSTHIRNIDALSTQEQIDAYDTTANWT